MKLENVIFANGCNTFFSIELIFTFRDLINPKCVCICSSAPRDALARRGQPTADVVQVDYVTFKD